MSYRNEDQIEDWLKMEPGDKKHFKSGVSIHRAPYGWAMVKRGEGARSLFIYEIPEATVIPGILVEDGQFGL